MINLPEYINGLPNICGSEKLVADAVRAGLERRVPPPAGPSDFKRIKGGFAIALHMHQPLIPAGGSELKTAEIISNLDDMMRHPDIGDNHNAPVFHWCYKRMGEFIPQLLEEGKQPRVMLEYSGALLHGLWKMGLHDVFDNLRRITSDPRYLGAVEWLGCPFGTRRRPIHTRAGFSSAGQSLAASLRRCLWVGGAGSRARLFAFGNGAAQSSGHRLRVRQDAQGLWLRLGAVAGT
jgi:hypothetical protein